MKKRRVLLRKKNIKREERKRRSRVFVRLGVIALVLGGLAVGGRYALSRLHFFSIEHLEVLGEPKTLKVEEIIQRSGVARGVNLFEVDLQEVQAKLKAHPYFKTVAVQ